MEYSVCKHFLNVRETMSSVVLGSITAVFTVHSTASYGTPAVPSSVMGAGDSTVNEATRPRLQGEQILPRGGKTETGNKQVNKHHLSL